MTSAVYMPAADEIAAKIRVTLKSFSTSSLCSITRAGRTRTLDSQHAAHFRSDMNNEIPCRVLQMRTFTLLGTFVACSAMVPDKAFAAPDTEAFHAYGTNTANAAPEVLEGKLICCCTGHILVHILGI